ncbi:MAG: histidinol-phosphatase [Deltaproteobacteria bacterium]|nr:histidinol-phosphatase [Deltaproteobacteria bacterium]
MFSLLIRRDGLIDPPAMSEFDAHCHILPRLDDGPADERTALAIARLLVEMGVRTVVATPHVMIDTYPNTTDAILAAVRSMRRLLKDSGLPLEIIAGAEYYAERGFLARIEAHDVLCFGEERFVLFESPVERPPMVLEDVVFSLKTAGYTPLLAHTERYRFLQDDKDAILSLRRLGVRFQINHPSFLLPRTSRRGELARLLYVKGFMDLLGTDMHRATAEYRVQTAPFLSRNPRLPS